MSSTTLQKAITFKMNYCLIYIYIFCKQFLIVKESQNDFEMNKHLLFL